MLRSTLHIHLFFPGVEESYELATTDAKLKPEKASLPVLLEMLTSMLMSDMPPPFRDATHVYVPKSVNFKSMMSRLVVPGDTSGSVCVMTILSELRKGRPFLNQLKVSSSEGTASTWQEIFTSRPIWMLSSLWYGSGVIQKRPFFKAEMCKKEKKNNKCLV